MKKICSKCGINKDESEFYRDKFRKDGLRWQCKECCRAYHQKYWQTNEGKEIKRKARRKHSQSDRGKEAKQKYWQTRIGKETKKKSDQKQYLLHPEKIKARGTVYKAVKRGQLIKQPCKCGCVEVQAHHEDYSKPLDVVWVCVLCHQEYHCRG